MTNKTKIILIYTGVVFICSIAIGGFTILGKLQDKRDSYQSPLATDMGKEIPQEFLRLKSDLTLTNQDGEKVAISDLKDKVWVFAQFFAKCPMCAQRNYNDLLDLYSKYKEHPNFVVVCMTVDPEVDTPKRLKEYANVINVDSRNWMFLTGDKKEMHEYMTKEMKFLDIRERTVPAEIAQKGRYAHDLGLAVFDENLVMRTKVDLSFARSQNEELFKVYSEKLNSAIQSALSN